MYQLARDSPAGARHRNRRSAPSLAEIQPARCESRDCVNMNPNFDMYYENPSNRSPTSQRQNSLHRQGSRNQFEPHGYLPSGLYTAEDHARYDATRFGDMRSATIGGYGGGYDMGGQSWNAGAFGSNNTLNGLGGPGLRKPPSRGGRSGIPSV